MSLSLVTAPTAAVLTVAEVRQQILLNSSAGEPCPTAPTVALVASAGLITAGVHRWLWVARTADGSTEAGTASAPLTTILATHGKATVTKPLGGSAVTYMDLYRTPAGGSTYLFVAATDNDGAPYTDNIADTSLGAAAPSVNTTADPELVRLIATATDRMELATQRAGMTQTWDLVLDAFPDDDYIEIPKPPLVPATGITSLKYRDTAGTLQTWAATNYVVEAPAGPRCRRGRLSLAYGVSWPSTYGQAGDVTVRFVCGHATASAVAPMLRQAMLVDIAALYANREGEAPMPDMVAMVYRSHKSWPRTRGDR